MKNTQIIQDDTKAKLIITMIDDTHLDFVEITFDT